MKGLGALQRHQLPHPLAKILDPPLQITYNGIVTSVQPLGDLPQRGSVLYTSCSALTQLLGRQELLLLQLLVYYYYYYTRSAVSFPGQDRHCDSCLLCTIQILLLTHILTIWVSQYQ